MNKLKKALIGVALVVLGVVNAKASIDTEQVLEGGCTTFQVTIASNTGTALFPSSLSSGATVFANVDYNRKFLEIQNVDVSSPTINCVISVSSVSVGTPNALPYPSGLSGTNGHLLDRLGSPWKLFLKAKDKSGNTFIPWCASANGATAKVTTTQCK